MALGTVQQIIPAGITQTYAVPLATEQIIPDEDLFLHVKNANGSACVLTFTDPGLTPAGNPAATVTVSVPATTGDKMIAVPRSLMSTSTGTIQVAFSVQTSVSVALLRM